MLQDTNFVRTSHHEHVVASETLMLLFFHRRLKKFEHMTLVNGFNVSISMVTWLYFVNKNISSHISIMLLTTYINIT